jgi:hypothetical protein
VGETVPKLPSIKPFQANQLGLDGLCMAVAEQKHNKAL